MFCKYMSHPTADVKGAIAGQIEPDPTLPDPQIGVRQLMPYTLQTAQPFTTFWMSQ